MSNRKLPQTEVLVKMNLIFTPRTLPAPFVRKITWKIRGATGPWWLKQREHLEAKETPMDWAQEFKGSLLRKYSTSSMKQMVWVIYSPPQLSRRPSLTRKAEFKSASLLLDPDLPQI